MLTALTCPTCGAPLPTPAAGASSMECSYCGGVSSLGGGPPSVGTGPRVALDKDASSAVIAAFKEAFGRHESPFEALVAASRARLGPFGETDAFARVVFALSQDFDRAHGTRVSEDPVAVSRFIQAYVQAIHGIAENGSYEINLPFLTATAAGPLHFAKTMTAADVAALATRAPGRLPAPAPAPAQAEPPKKKRGFWPF